MAAPPSVAFDTQVKIALLALRTQIGHLALLPLGADGSRAAGGAAGGGAPKHERPPAVGAIGKLGQV